MASFEPLSKLKGGGGGHDDGSNGFSYSGSQASIRKTALGFGGSLLIWALALTCLGASMQHQIGPQQ